jgi:myo-inositol 2-dehydrogenase/D-chiro-inositol 1-dehydrogenase
MKLRVGIAGAGYAGGVHAENLRNDERVEISAIFDVDPARRSGIATANFHELLGCSDAIYITSPNTRHAEMALQALAAGKHVFCEKPMATTLQDARRVLGAASSSGTVFQMGHNRRFTPLYKSLKELLLQSPPHTAHIKMNRGELLNPAWTGDDSVTGGFLYETPIHMFDMMRFQFGEIATLDARLSGPNDFSMLIEFVSGMHATFVTSPTRAGFSRMSG